jgi:ABC-type branched-subunit amino acid transport system permease subunit
VRLPAALQQRSGTHLIQHAVLVAVVAGVFLAINGLISPIFSYYLALAAMYATAMFGMVILVGLSGQVSLGNGALMAVGAYTFALTSLNWETVPILGLPWNAVWSVIAAGFVGIVAGLIIGGLGARLRGPYLAGLTLGIAVGIPSIVTRFPEGLGGEDGLALRVPYPAGGYAALNNEAALAADSALEDANKDEAFEDFLAEGGADSGGVVEFDQEDLTAEGDPFAEGEVLEFDQEEMIADQEATSPEATGEAMPMVSPSPSFDAGTAAPENGIAVDGSPYGAGDLIDAAGFVLEQWQASLAIVMACIVGFMALNLIRGQQGRRWQAVRDDPVAAALVGISPQSSKVSAFVVSGFFAALAGAVFAQILAYVGPAVFGLGLSLSLLVGVILGGRSSLIGAVLGAVFIVMLPEVVQALSEQTGWSDQVANNLPDLLYGLLVVVVVLVLPGGLMGALVAARRSRARRRPV